jgi:hypothetical protein
MIWTQSSRYGIVLAVKWSNFIYNVKRNSGSLVRGMNRWVESFEVRGLYSLKSKYARWCFSIHSLKSSENNYDSFDFLNIWKTITKYCEFIFIRGIPIFLKWTLYRRIATRKIYEFEVKIHEFKYFKTFFYFCNRQYMNLTIPRNPFFPNPRKLVPAKLNEFTVKLFEFFLPFFHL